MSAVLSETFCVRPDIFLKSAEDRLYLRHRERHYLLRLDGELLESALRFLDCNDGTQPLHATLAQIPGAHHRRLLRLLDFLVEKDAAFRMCAGPTPAELSPVRDTLLYLGEYVSDPVERYQAFAARRLLVIGAGLALSSLVRTLSRLGIQELAVMVCQPGSPHLSEAEVSSAFHETKSWPGARLAFLPPQAQLGTLQFDEILHCDATLVPEVSRPCASHAAPVQRYGVLTRDTLYITDDFSDALALSMEQQGSAATTSDPVQALIAGAVLALACFDWLTGVNPHPFDHYQYYNLREQGSRRLVRRSRLRPLNEPAPQEPSEAPHLDSRLPDMLRTEWDELAVAPLFPVELLTEQTESDSYIKLYTLALRAHASGVPPRPALAAAGFDKGQCQKQIALTLIGRYGLWFDGSSPGEFAACARAARYFARTQLAVAALRDRTPEPRELPAWVFTGREEYIAFCIGTAFDERVSCHDVDSDDPEFPRCLISCAGDVAVYMPYLHAPTEQDREALLFGLYTALWARGAADPYTVADVFLPASLTALHGVAVP